MAKGQTTTLATWVPHVLGGGWTHVPPSLQCELKTMLLLAGAVETNEWLRLDDVVVYDLVDDCVHWHRWQRWLGGETIKPAHWRR